VVGAGKTRPRLEDLSDSMRYRLRWIAFSWMMGVTLFNGVNLVLKKPTLDAYPGTHDDPVMRVIMFAALTGFLAALFKFPAVWALGPWLERRLRGNEREVRLRDIFHPGIRAMAFWGGGLQFLYQIVVIALVTEVSPSGISAAKACVVIPLAALELWFGQLKPKGGRWWARLVVSMLFTIAGAGIVIFEGGFKLFATGGIWAIVGLAAFTILGNGLLAYAEIQEYRGVHDRVVAAPVYSLARVVAYTVCGFAGVVIWGAFQSLRGINAWGTAVGVVHMCIDRWELVLPVAVIGAICDTSRICVKAIISATYMYTMLAAAVLVDILLQIPAKYFWPDVYDNVHPGMHTVVVATLGAVLLGIGIGTHPKPTKKDLQPVTLATPI
jgi:hypothetical protein